MVHIRKAPETMTSKERVRRTFAREKTDRVTIGFDVNPGIFSRTADALGIYNHDYLTVADVLGVDYVGVGAPYIGPSLYEAPENRRVDPLEGCRMRWVEHESGGYWDFCDFPLADASEEEFAAFPIPDPDDFDYDAAAERARAHADRYALFSGGPGTPDIINSNGRIMGMEDVLCHLILKNDAALDFIRRRASFQLKNLERTLDACRGYLDFVWLGEDLGTQHVPMISLELYRDVMKPIHKQFIDLADAYHLPVMIHTCGASSWVYEDFIEMGVSAVDSLQPEAAGMSAEALTANFGGRLGFRGLISTAGPLAYGTPEEVREVVHRTLDTMMPYRGYHFAPSHAIQDNTPTENVLAMYQAAHDFGRYQ